MIGSKEFFYTNFHLIGMRFIICRVELMQEEALTSLTLR